MEKSVYTVKQLNGEIKNLVEQSYRSIWVEGEISGLSKPASGHLYFSLKEESSLIRCAYFRNRQYKGGYLPTEGSQVLLQGQISYYEPRGDLQLIVSFLEDAGEGALRRAFEKLKENLQQKGYFDQDIKKTMPDFPTTTGIITSETGAVIKDILTTLKRRNPGIKVVLYPTRVQGESAEVEISQSIEIADHRNECDILILARGGGSLEDLQAFNSEMVADAIFHCKTPIISAVGHETDVSIADFVADQRAPTPTAAAELVSLDTAQLSVNIKGIKTRLIQLLSSDIDRRRQTADYLQARLTNPEDALQNWQLQKNQAVMRLSNGLQLSVLHHQNRLKSYQFTIVANSPLKRLTHYRQSLFRDRKLICRMSQVKLNQLANNTRMQKEKLHLMAPQNTLNRGYAIVQRQSGEIVSRSENVSKKENLKITVSKGTIDVAVTKTN